MHPIEGLRLQYRKATMIRIFDSLIVLLVFIQQTGAYYSAIQEYSRCAFPCARQGKSFVAFDGNSIFKFTHQDPRVMVVTDGNGFTFKTYCIERTGPFYVVGRNIHGVHEYRCIKDTIHDPFDDNTRVLYTNNYRRFLGKPDICDVCNGGWMKAMGFVNSLMKQKDCGKVKPKELGCNIPWFCPIKNPKTQLRCSPCEPSERLDDGFCCRRSVILK